MLERMSYVPKQTTPRQRFRVRYLVEKKRKIKRKTHISNSKVDGSGWMSLRKGFIYCFESLCEVTNRIGFVCPFSTIICIHQTSANKKQRKNNYIKYTRTHLILSLFPHILHIYMCVNKTTTTKITNKMKES